MIDVGYKNYLDPKRVLVTMPPNSSHAKWLIKEAATGRHLIDCTHGRKTSTILILNSGHVVLSSLKKSSISRRLESGLSGEPEQPLPEEEENIPE